MSGTGELPCRIKTEEEISADRMAKVESEIIDFRRGFIKRLYCPYCGSLNKPDDEFCCAKMTLAVAAVCDKIELQERQAFATQIENRLN